MKNKIKELDVDIIGGLGQLTEEESKSLSAYFAKQKVKKANEKGKKLPNTPLLKPNKKVSLE
jgi:hypothetical protein